MSTIWRDIALFLQQYIGEGGLPEQIHFMVELQSFAEVLVLTVQVLCSGSTGPVLHPLVLPKQTKYTHRDCKLVGQFMVYYLQTCGVIRHFYTATACSVAAWHAPQFHCLGGVKPRG